MWKQFSLNASYRWVDLLPALVHTYNHRKHRTINARPVNVTPTTRLSFAANESPSPCDGLPFGEEGFWRMRSVGMPGH